MSFEKFIAESMMVRLFERVKDKIVNKSAHTHGVLHELLVGYHLNGGSHMRRHPNVKGQTPKQAHDHLASLIDKASYKDIYDKAAEAAQVIRDTVKKPIKKVSWTSKPGDIERVTGKPATQDEDASDIYLHHHDDDHEGEKDFTGVSLKARESLKNKTSDRNIGHGTLDTILGVNTRSHLEAARQRLAKKHPAVKNKSLKQARELFAKNPKISQSEKAERAVAIAKIAADHHKAFSGMSQQKLWDHLYEMNRGRETNYPTMRVSSTGTNGKYTHKVDSPHAKHVENWGERPANGSKEKNISVHLINGRIEFRHKKTGAIITHRYKSDGASGVMGPVKVSVESKQ